MKILFTIILFVTFFSTSFSQNALLPAYPREIIGEGVIGNIAYFKGDNRPFTGVLVDETTQKKIGEYKNGYKNGIFREYYSNGKKKSECKYINGQRDGICTEWFENKQLKSSHTYSNGTIVDGKYITYLENGQKGGEETFKNGEIILSAKYEDGKLKELSKFSVEYYPNGQKKNKECLTNGKKDKQWFTWYEGGQKRSEINHKNGVLDGQWLKWFEDGKQEIYGIYDNGQKVGFWISYYAGGQMKSDEIYRNGNLYGRYASWYENGRIKSKGNYINGKKEGEFIEDEDIGGQKTIYYKNGNIDVLTTNSVKYYKPAKNSKLLHVLSDNPNEFVIVNFILESNMFNEPDLILIKNSIIQDDRFQEIPEAEYNAYKDNIIKYKLYYFFYFKFQTMGSLYGAILKSQLQLIDIYNKKVGEEDYSTYSDWKQTKKDALSEVLFYNMVYLTNKFIDEYFPME